MFRLRTFFLSHSLSLFLVKYFYFTFQHPSASFVWLCFHDLLPVQFFYHSLCSFPLYIPFRFFSFFRLSLRYEAEYPATFLFPLSCPSMRFFGCLTKKKGSHLSIYKYFPLFLSSLVKLKSSYFHFLLHHSNSEEVALLQRLFLLLFFSAGHFLCVLTTESNSARPLYHVLQLDLSSLSPITAMMTSIDVI